MMCIRSNHLEVGKWSEQEERKMIKMKSCSILCSMSHRDHHLQLMGTVDEGDDGVYIRN